MQMHRQLGNWCRQLHPATPAALGTHSVSGSPGGNCNTTATAMYPAPVASCSTLVTRKYRARRLLPRCTRLALCFGRSMQTGEPILPVAGSARGHSNSANQLSATIKVKQ
jgi:hypothetical protein